MTRKDITIADLEAVASAAGMRVNVDLVSADRTHLARLLAAYDLVIGDLGDWTEGQWVFVRERLKEMRADVVGTIEEETR